MTGDDHKDIMDMSKDVGKLASKVAKLEEGAVRFETNMKEGYVRIVDEIHQHRSEAKKELAQVNENLNAIREELRPVREHDQTLCDIWNFCKRMFWVGVKWSLPSGGAIALYLFAKSEGLL